jgi:hypothetical protein
VTLQIVVVVVVVVVDLGRLASPRSVVSGRVASCRVRC